ncbi:MAG: hypothetical protein WA979_03230 [Pacificimonas sp.]
MTTRFLSIGIGIGIFLMLAGGVVFLKHGPSGALSSLNYPAARVAQASGTARTLLAPDRFPAPRSRQTPRADERRLPAYFPIGALRAPASQITLLCDESLAAGEAVYKNGKSFPTYAGDGLEVTVEARDDSGAPCRYPFALSAPKNGSGASGYGDGSQYIFRSSVPGVRAIFSSDNQWAAFGLKGGKKNGRRIHIEIRDIAFEYQAGVQASGGIWNQIYPDAASGGLVTFALINVSVTGGKNALFSPSGNIMMYVADSDIGGNVGKHFDQHHSVYVNAIRSFHAVDSWIGGQRSTKGTGGHQLKSKARINILEDVTLDNGGGEFSRSNRPLADLSAFSYTWSTGLRLIRREPDPEERRNALVDIRRDRYGPSEVPLPFPDAAGWTMPVAPGDCGNIDQIPSNGVYLQIFRNTKVLSATEEPFIFRANGVVDTRYEGIHPKASHDDLMANPRRNRALVLTFDSDFDGGPDSGDGYFYLKPSYPTYHCADPELTGAFAGLTGDRDRFIAHAFSMLDRAQAARPR